MNFYLTSTGPVLGHTTPLVDAQQDLTTQGFSYDANNTVIRFKRPLNTGDEEDVIIEVIFDSYLRHVLILI